MESRFRRSSRLSRSISRNLVLKEALNTYDLSYIPICLVTSIAVRQRKVSQQLHEVVHTNFRSKVYQLSIKSVSTFHQKCIRASNKPNNQQDLSLDEALFTFYLYVSLLRILLITIAIFHYSSSSLSSSSS